MRDFTYFIRRICQFIDQVKTPVSIIFSTIALVIVLHDCFVKGEDKKKIFTTALSLMIVVGLIHNVEWIANRAVI